MTSWFSVSSQFVCLSPIQCLALSHINCGSIIKIYKRCIRISERIYWMLAGGSTWTAMHSIYAIRILIFVIYGRLWSCSTSKACYMLLSSSTIIRGLIPGLDSRPCSWRELRKWSVVIKHNTFRYIIANQFWQLMFRIASPGLLSFIVIHIPVDVHIRICTSYCDCLLRL